RGCEPLKSGKKARECQCRMVKRKLAMSLLPSVARSLLWVQMDWKTLLAYISGSVDEELLLRNAYLVTENRILRDQIKGRVQLSDAERLTLSEIGRKLGKKALEEVAHIVKPDTILAWQRKLA